VGAGRAELDCFDVVEGLVIQGGQGVEVLNAISLHGALVESWPRAKITAQTVVPALISHWRRHGLPRYAQFDNDTIFQGPHHHRDTIGRVTRLCVNLGVVPVFVPPRETGFQASIESFNGRWQTKVWNRFHFDSRAALGAQSSRFVQAHRRRHAARIDSAPPRSPFPPDWTLDLQTIRAGQIIYLRRTDADGRIHLLGQTFPVDAHWPHRLVRAEVDLRDHCIRCYALRRRDPQHQPLLKVINHGIPQRPFAE
jgi:hypothetical protein